MLTVLGGEGSSVQDLTIRLSQDVEVALEISNTARRIEVVEHGVPSRRRTGVDLGDMGTLEDSSVKLAGAQDTIAVSMFGGAAAVRRSTLTAHTGVYSYGGAIERSRVSATDVGVGAYRGATTIASSLIRFSEEFGRGVAAGAVAGSDTTVDADGVTIVGPGLPDTAGASANNWGAPTNTVQIGLNNSIIRGVSSALVARTPPVSAGHALVAAAYSDYAAGGNETVGASASLSQANVSDVGDAGFVDAAVGDFRLRPGSPAAEALGRQPICETANVGGIVPADVSRRCRQQRDRGGRRERDGQVHLDADLGLPRLVRRSRWPAM